jgi:hypothetical protein
MLNFAGKEIRQFQGKPTRTSILRDLRLLPALRDIDTSVVRIACARIRDEIQELRYGAGSRVEYNRAKMEDKLYTEELIHREALKQRYGITPEMYWEEYQTHLIEKSGN